MPTSQKPKRTPMLSQMDLAGHIFDFLAKHGFESANCRQLNAVYSASTAIVQEYNRPTVHSTAGMGLEAWLKSDDTGSSSLFMAASIFPELVPNAPGILQSKAYPLDPDDFGRCYRFLIAVPEAKERLHLVRASGGLHWEALIDYWPQLTVLFEEEQKAGRAPRLYARMRELIG